MAASGWSRRAGVVALLASSALLALSGTARAIMGPSTPESFTYYVERVGGSDTNSCTTIEAPCQTLAGALKEAGTAPAGSTLTVMISGTLTETHVTKVDFNVTIEG